MRPVPDRDKFHGAFLGLVVGDALGTTLEFKPPGTFQPIDDMVGGGPFGLEAGEWTDDTSMAMCLAESLLARGGFDPVDQLDRFRQWYRAGYWSCRDECFDIGNTVRAAVEEFERTKEAFCGSTHPNTAGNGSIMRLAPVPLYYLLNPPEAISLSGISSRTTHGATACVDACRYMAALILSCFGEDTREGLYSRAMALLEEEGGAPLCPEIREIAEGGFRKKKTADVKGTGYVVASLEAALWAFDQARDFKEGALLAVNLGDDADTTGAVYGQIAGAFFGSEGIPLAWRERIAWRKQLERLSEKLFKAALRR